MQRLPDLSLEALTREQQRIASLFQNRPGGIKRGPLMAWLHAPELAERAQALGTYCRFGSSLAPRHSELAILVTAAWWAAEYEWKSHVGPARAAGLEEPVLDAIRQQAVPEFSDFRDAVVYRFSRELLEGRRVSDAAWADAEAAFGARGVVDLIGVLGYYGLISMTICAVQIEPDGKVAGDERLRLTSGQ